MKKRIVSILLALSLLCSLLPASALPVGAETTSGTCGDNLTWTFDPNTGVLTITGSGKMADWNTPSYVPWYEYRTKIKVLSLPSDVTSIGDWAFYGCSSLMDVTIGNSVTSIGFLAFSNCTSLTGVSIGSSVTSIGKEAFSNCTSLTGVSIGSSVTSIGHGAFFNCTSMTSVTIPNSVTSIGEEAFGNCCSLKKFSVASGNQAYSNDSTGVLFNKNKTELVKCPGGFQGGYVVPSSVTGIDNWAFYFCSSLESVTIPPSVTSIGNGAFEGCTSLPSATIPSSVTSIGDWAFSQCTSLQSVTIPSSVTSIGDRAFSQCTSLPSVTIPSSVTSIGNGAFEGCTSLPSVTIPSSVTSIGNRAFGDCTSLASVTIPLKVNNIGSGAFSGCEALVDVYYAGYAAAWKLIRMWDNNDALRSARIHWHTFSAEGHWTYMNTAPTCTEAGMAYEQCSCGYVRNEIETPALGHDFVDGVCTRCGKEQEATDIFTDLNPGGFYLDAVNWAVKNGITTGTSATTFSPNKTCTRSEVVTFLWRAAGQPEPTTTENPFTDVKTTDWYYKAVLWAVENGVTSGTGGTTFSPKRQCMRGEVVTFLWRAAGQPDPTSIETAFTDVDPKAYYYKAMLWAVEKGITKGTTATTFAPKKTCTRGEIVTFLYRADS